MRETLLRGWRQFVRLNDWFAESLGQLLSLSVWLTVMVLGTAVWLTVNSLLPHPFDQGPDYPRLVLVLTITTALDAAATKLYQMSQRRQDEKREAALAEIIQKIRDVSVDTSAITVEIRAMLDKSEPRDKAMHALMECVAEALELRGGDPSEH